MNKIKIKYNPKQSEKKIQSFWKKNDYFKFTNKGNKTFSIIMPPPNVTGKLHLGHAWDSYYPDMLIRYKQLNGFESIWYPGMDHAGIATQAKVEQKIFNEYGKNRFDIGREEFICKVWDWKEHYALNIESQWDKLGIALDYDKTKFTLDNDVNSLVLDSFINLYNKGLIFKGKRLINWDPVLKTAISNIEILHKVQNSKIYNIKYKFENSNEYIIIATTRPETMFGDAAIFVNPNDKRHKEKIGKFVINPSNGERLEIMSDKFVDIEFGTGILKVTPAHDFNDYKLYKKYNLKLVNIMNEDATLNELCGKYSGMNIDDVRKSLINEFGSNGVLDSILDYKKTVGISERSGSIVIPMISEQWFLKSSHLAKMANDAQKKDSTKIDFYPSRFEQVYIDWLKNMEDWCISRQLWWGHRIPVWYKNKEMKIQIESPGKEWIQDEDVLDTWFSSALWPIAFLNKDVISRSDNINYLSDTLFTGYDIILFWVSRMIYQSLELKEKSPFKKVIIHGLIRDKYGKKMSKSLNNGINPIDVIHKWGSDSLRSFLLGNSTPGQDIKFNEIKIQSAWDLNNKLFNSWKLLQMLIGDNKIERKSIKNLNLSKIDKYIVSKISLFKKILDNNIEEYNLSIIFNEMNKIVFDDFSNNYLEFIKQDKKNIKQLSRAINIFTELLILLHPMIPFVTEEIYQEMKNISSLKKSIMEERFSSITPIFDYDIKLLLASLKVARIINSKMEFKKNDNVEIFIETDKKININFINKYISYLNAYITTKKKDEYNEIEIFPDIGIIYSTFDKANNKSIDELRKIIFKKIKFEIKRSNWIVSNKKFMSNSNSQLVKNEKKKIKFYSDSLEFMK
ncbi:MAG: valine--tRNA ligase [Mycoplasmataceae bacterium]|nr:valine--tRNA ligase [Mycoplasmataceae bacterium]